MNQKVKVINMENGEVIEGKGFYAVEHGEYAAIEMIGSIEEIQQLTSFLLAHTIEQIINAHEVKNLMEKMAIAAEYMDGINQMMAIIMSKQMAENMYNEKMGGLN